ncbi:Rap1a/Tai family immunity protein [Rhizobium skierniewicense]|uniref:Rap1a/Tai family immunity protein n=1 Tax=Rhizobium skierniewicense TaxID=984260 RepID=UPI00307F5F24
MTFPSRVSIGKQMFGMYPALVLTTFLSWVGFALPSEAADRTWIYSGSELKQAIEGKLAPDVSNPELRRLVSVAKSNAYIAGVADLTANAHWCGAGDIAPHEITDRVYTYLVDIPSEKLAEPAAALVEEALVIAFPCEPKKN